MSLALGPLLEACALEEGFALAGALDLELAAPAIAAHVERYDRWLRDGRAGAMQYLERGRDRRADPRQAFAEARSVLSVALPYPKRAGGAAHPAQGPRYARYISGRDYHDVLAEMLERALRRAAERSGLGPELRYKVCVDTSAVLERSWAALAGLGWIGRNTLLIHPRLGSYFFLAEALVNQPTGQGPRPLPDYCGRCTRCLDACPTRALTEPHWLDSRRCISYWTLEKRGELPLLEADKRAMGTWVAGCDLCQEVCPFNLKPTKAEAAAAGDEPQANLSSWQELLDEPAEAYARRARASALSRVKPAQFSRNLAIALANAVTGHRSELAPLRRRVQDRLEAESDPVARAEWRRCLLAFDDK